jgi:hypothetical protein
MRKLTAFAAALAAAAVFTGCTEIAQEPGKSYAGKEDSKPYAGDQFKGDKAKWEASLAQRNQGQNDYARIVSEKK